MKEIRHLNDEVFERTLKLFSTLVNVWKFKILLQMFEVIFEIACKETLSNNVTFVRLLGAVIAYRNL